jgi:hypothetical protein
MDKGSKEAAGVVGHSQETQLLVILTQSSVGVRSYNQNPIHIYSFLMK